MKRIAPEQLPIPRQWRFVVGAAFALLIVVGIGASVLRANFLADLGTRLEPLRGDVLGLFGLTEPNVVRRAAEVARIDGKFAAHPLATMLHVVLGAALLVLVPLQFSRSIRSRSLRGHRWLGRLLLVVAWISGLTGLFFGVLHPFAGAGERAIIGVMGCYFLLASSIAFVRVRSHRIAEHREWMIRTVATALGISTVRIVVLPIDVILTPAGAGPQTVFLVSVWVGWGVTLAAAEWWIRRTRLGRPAAA